MIERTGARTLTPALCEWRAELAAVIGDDAARVQLLREAHHLYEQIGAAAGATHRPPVIGIDAMNLLEFKDEDGSVQHLSEAHGVPADEALKASTFVNGRYVYYGPRRATAESEP